MMKTLRLQKAALSFFSALFIALVLSGCGSSIAANFSASASMRVEVEVYKGPLSKSVESQWGEFVGTVNEASDAFTTFRNSLKASIKETDELDKLEEMLMSGVVSDIEKLLKQTDHLRSAINTDSLENLTKRMKAASKKTMEVRRILSYIAPPSQQTNQKNIGKLDSIINILNSSNKNLTKLNVYQLNFHTKKMAELAGIPHPNTPTKKTGDNPFVAIWNFILRLTKEIKHEESDHEKILAIKKLLMALEKWIPKETDVMNAQESLRNAERLARDVLHSTSSSRDRVRALIEDLNLISAGLNSVLSRQQSEREQIEELRNAIESKDMEKIQKKAAFLAQESKGPKPINNTTYPTLCGEIEQKEAGIFVTT